MARYVSSRALAPILAGGALVLTLAAGPAVAQSPDKVRIAGLLALTGPGAASGLSYQMGLQMAVKDFNDAGGIGGKPAEAVFADDQSDATIAVGEAKRLVFQDKL